MRIPGKPRGSVRLPIGLGARRTRENSSRHPLPSPSPGASQLTPLRPSPLSHGRFAAEAAAAEAAQAKPATAAAEADEEELGVTPQILDFLRTLSPDTFKSSAHQLQGGSVEAATGDLTGWQERHAVLVLSKAKELAKIRYDLCPRHM